jgi:hypothetical protein
LARERHREVAVQGVGDVDADDQAAGGVRAELPGAEE